MRSFQYEARDQNSGKIIKSSIQAESEIAAAKLLISQNLAPINVKEKEDSGILARFRDRISLKDKTIFSRQLSTLISAGLPISQALRTSMEQTQNKKLQAVIQDIIVSVESGKNLADSVANHKSVFNIIFISLIRAGEASGTLDAALQRIADQQEKDAAILGKIKSALVYPAVVLVVVLGVAVFMLVTVIPQIKDLYVDFQLELPLITSILVAVSDFITNFWWLLIIILIGSVFFIKQYSKTDSGIRTAASFKLNVPAIKKLLQKLYMARISRTTQVLLASGVSIIDSLKLVADAVNNVIIKETILRAVEKITSGKSLSSALENEKYILSLLPQMIKIGEQSGKIDEMMGKAAQAYEDELDEQIRNISTLIEPILIVFMAVVVGGLLAAVLLPVYGLINKVNI